MGFETNWGGAALFLMITMYITAHGIAKIFKNNSLARTGAQKGVIYLISRLWK